MIRHVTFGFLISMMSSCLGCLQKVDRLLHQQFSMHGALQTDSKTLYAASGGWPQIYSGLLIDVKHRAVIKLT